MKLTNIFKFLKYVKCNFVIYEVYILFSEHFNDLSEYEIFLYTNSKEKDCFKYVADSLHILKKK